MPRRDGTGPMGHGPRTGWGLGSCSAGPEPENVPQAQGRGFGRGFGPGRGFGRGRGLGRRARGGGFLAQQSPEEEQHFLEEHRHTLQSRLDDINRRLDELTAREPQQK
jgi:hypothetical protein